MHNLSQFTCNLSLNILIGRSPWAGKPFDLPSNIWAAHTETHIPLWQRLPIVPLHASSPSFFYYKVLIFSKAHVCPARSLLSYSLLLLGVARWPSYSQWNASTSGVYDFFKRKLFALFLPMGWSVGVMGSQLWPCRWGQARRGRQNRWKEHETLGDCGVQPPIHSGFPPISWPSCERERSYLVCAIMFGGLVFKSSLTWILTNKGHSFIFNEKFHFLSMWRHMLAFFFLSGWEFEEKENQHCIMRF